MIEEVVQAPRKPQKKSLVRKGTLGRKTTLKRAQGKLKPKKWKFVKSHLQECDDAFAREIRERDGKCLFPGCEKTTDLTCSHYIGRSNWNTRFDYRNCITLCTTHHFWDKTIGWEYQKQRVGVKGCDWDGRYTLHMKRILGEEGFGELLAEAEGKKSRKEAIIEAQNRYGLRQE